MFDVSIVTPSLNQAKYIERTIQSVAAQGHVAEHIVVDGGSRDGTLDLLSRHAATLTWSSEGDRGQAHAVNKGLQAARGEVIGWLNSDDLYMPHAVQKVCDFFSRNPSADVVFGHARYVNEDDDAIGHFHARAFRRRRLRSKNVLCQPAVFMRRRVVDRCGLLNENLRFWMDYEYWLRLDSQNIRFARLPETLAAYRFHSENKTMGNPSLENAEQAAAEILQVMADKFDKVPLRWLLNYGRVKARKMGLSRDQSTQFDSAVLRHALGAARRGNRGPEPVLSTKCKLLVRHAVKEFESIVRRPANAVRFVPIPPRVRAHLPHKLFELRNYEPRALVTQPRSSQRLPTTDVPTISIVTPNFNCGRFLERTIRSVLEQDYGHVDYIVQDGGSTDDSVDIIHRYKSQLAAWTSGPDRGQAHAINLGMQRSRGEIMAYLNSDDILLPGALAYVAEYFRRHPHVDAVYGHRILIDENDRDIGRWILPPHDHKVLAWVDYIPQETLFWRRRAWDRVGGKLDESFRFAMDWDLILRFRAAGLKFVRLPRFLGAFRITEEQKTNRLSAVGQLEIERLLKRTFGRIPSAHARHQEMKRFLRRHWVLDKLYFMGIVRY